MSEQEKHKDTARKLKSFLRNVSSRLEMNSTDYLHTWCVVIQERTDKNNKPSILSSGDVSVSHEGFSGSRYLVPVYRNKHSTAEQLFPAQSELQCFILYLRTPLKYNTCVNLLDTFSQSTSNICHDVLTFSVKLLDVSWRRRTDSSKIWNMLNVSVL